MINAHAYLRTLHIFNGERRGLGPGLIVKKVNYEDLQYFVQLGI